MQIKQCTVDWQTEPARVIRVYFDFGGGFYKWGIRKFGALEFMAACDYAEKVALRYNRRFGKNEVTYE